MLVPLLFLRSLLPYYSRRRSLSSPHSVSAVTLGTAMDAPEENLVATDVSEVPVNLNEQYPGDVEKNHEEAEQYYGELEQNQWKTKQNYEDIERQWDTEENHREIPQGYGEIEQHQGEIEEHYDNIENNKGEMELDHEEIKQKQHEQENHDELGAGVANIDKRWPGWPGDTVFRILVPAQKVGGIIGRKGEFIKKMCEETKARIKILDGPPGDLERAVMISAKEERSASISPAMNGLLCVHKRIVDLDAESATYPPIAGNVIRTRLLVPASQAGILIGKHGATIKSIQEASTCVLRIVEDLPLLALHDDRVAEIQGEPTGVHRAVELVAGHLRKFLVDRSVLPLFEMHTSMPNAYMEQNFPPRPQSWGLPPQNIGPGGFGSNPPFLPPRPPRDSFCPMLDLPPLEKQPPHGVSAYGREAPHIGVHSATIDPPPGTTSQVTHHMQVPLSYADAVIGTSGANISYIRRASGATITIQETRGVPSEMTVEINGSATQIQIAQQLIQNFMAEAGATSQNPAPSADQDYSSYQSQSHDRYMSAPTNAGPVGHSAAGYGSGYGTNYGY